MILIGAYLPMSTLDHVPGMEEELKRLLDGEPVVLEELNADIGLLSNPRDQHVSDFLASFGSVDLLGNSQERPRGGLVRQRDSVGRTWW